VRHAEQQSCQACGAGNLARSRLQSLLKKAKVHWPPMNADERGLRTIALSVLICVHPRPNLPFPDFFSNLFSRRPQP
jgi:hypothetical protein